jgi:aminoglycoside N3'-acetyltransferase
VISARKLAILIIRKLTGKTDVRSFWRTKQLAVKKRFYKNIISVAELREAFVKLGITRGRTVWVQSSWNEFYNFPGKPSTVIDLLLEMIGPNGTLVMPAIPLDLNPTRVLMIDREPVSTGLICEVFRRYPSVVRSIHLSSSVIARGPQADFLVKDHHTTEVAWDRSSPFQRLMDVDALCIGIGVGRFREMVLTPIHAVECILRDEIPLFTSLFQQRATYQWRSKDGREGKHTFLVREGSYVGARLGRHYLKDQYSELRVSNLWLWSISARDAIETGVALARKGISIYRAPLFHRLRSSMKSLE